MMMNGKAGSKSPASRLRGIGAFNSLNRTVLGRPKLRKAHSVQSESELFKAVDGASRVAVGREFGMSKTPPLHRTACKDHANVLSFKLRASSTWKELDGKTTPSSNEAEIINKQGCESAQKARELDGKDLSLKVRQLIQQILASHLDNMEYNHETCGAKCRTISQMIENGVKSLYSVRQHKISALVYIGAIRDRGIEISSQCVWNPTTDSFAMATFDNDSLFATGIVFATLFNDE